MWRWKKCDGFLLNISKGVEKGCLTMEEKNVEVCGEVEKKKASHLKIDETTAETGFESKEGEKGPLDRIGGAVRLAVRGTKGSGKMAQRRFQKGRNFRITQTSINRNQSKDSSNLLNHKPKGESQGTGGTRVLGN